MSVKFSFSQSLLLNDDNINIALVEGDTGDYGKFSSLNDRNNNSDRKNHPTNELLETNTQNTLLCEGSIKFTESWEDSWSNNDVDTAMSLMLAAGPNNIDSTWVTNNRISTVNYSDREVTTTVANIADQKYSDWGTQNRQYALKTNNIRIETTSDNTKFMCVTYLANSFNLWTSTTNNIAAGESLSISKSGTTYLVFTGPVVKDGLTLNSYCAYKMKSDTLNVENQSNNNVVVFKWDK